MIFFSDRCLFYHIDIVGDVLQTLTAITSTSQCQFECQMEKQCLFFTFNVATNECMLKPGLGSRVAGLQAYYTSGPKHCGFSTGIKDYKKYKNSLKCWVTVVQR